MQFATIFFDLDDTLYPPASGLWDEIGERINQYLHERLGFPPERVVAVREHYFHKYGTTLRGLQIHHAVDMDDYLAFVHNVPLERYLKPDAALRQLLAGIPARKWIFTNADANHAHRVLQQRGLQGIFDGIIDIHVLAPYCKPMPQAFQIALKAAGDPDPRACLLIDDQARVTHAARSLGFHTALVHSPLSSSSDADVILPTLLDLAKVFQREN